MPNLERLRQTDSNGGWQALSLFIKIKTRQAGIEY